MNKMFYSTPKGLTAKAKLDAIIKFKIAAFNEFVAKPLDIIYDHKIINGDSSIATIIFTFQLNGIDVSLQWQGDSIILHSSNQNRVIKDCLLTPQWVMINVMTLALV